MGDHIIPIHPGLEDAQAFTAWVNKVLEHRHGRMMPIDGCIVYDTEWTTNELKNVKRTNTSTLNPRRMDEPVIILRGLSKDYLLDGNRRINTWIKEDNKEKHRAWLVCPLFSRETICRTR